MLLIMSIVIETLSGNGLFDLDLFKLDLVLAFNLIQKVLLGGVWMGF